jgi:hypothetical protein
LGQKFEKTSFNVIEYSIKRIEGIKISDVTPGAGVQKCFQGKASSFKQIFTLVTVDIV